MLKQTTAERVLDAAVSGGADFAEIFLEHTGRSQISVVNGKVEQAFGGVEHGAGIRLFFGSQAIYGYTNDTSEEGLIRTAKEAAAAARGAGGVQMGDFFHRRRPNINPIQRYPSGVAKQIKAELLLRASRAAFSYHDLITQTRCTAVDVEQSVLVVNTDGLWAEDKRVRSRFSIEAVASEGGQKQSGYTAPGGSVGFELYDKIDVEEEAERAAKTAVTMLGAQLCPAGRMPVVIDNGFGGVIFHEACGHGLEAAAVARNASVFAGKLGQQIASPLVTAIDDGTIANAWGSANMDDEGTPTRKNVLIEKGVLKTYLVDKLNGRKLGLASTGSARRESYRFAPSSRMSNTYIAAGNSRPEEIIAQTEYGLYAKQMGGGSVDPATGVFNFAVLEGYLIRNGKITTPVRGATLIGKGAEVLMKIDMVGNNPARAQGMCGSISGSIPTDVGQPMIRVSELTVGGRRG